jgi:hypothetical protein
MGTKFMKISYQCLILSLGFNSLAFGDVSEKKQKMLERIDARIQMLQKKRGCVASATTKKDLKACKHKFREEKKALKEKHSDQ